MQSYLKLFVFVCVACCVCAASRTPLFPHRKSVRSALRESSVTFTPKLPCGYVAMLQIHSDENMAINTSVNKHQMAFTGLTPSGELQTILIRKDNGKLMVHQIQSNTCKTSSGDTALQMYMMLKMMYLFYTEEVSCESVEDGEFNGKKCKKYTNCDIGMTSDAILYVDDNRVIGYQIAGSQGYAEVSYKLSTPAESTFVVDAKNVGCDASAYTAPTMGTCSHFETLSQPSLPCNYEYDLVLTDSLGTTTQKYLVNKDHLKYEEVDEVHRVILFRKDGSEYTMHSYDNRSQECVSDDEDPIEIKENYDDIKETLAVFEGKIECDNVEDGEFEGKKCKKYIGCDYHSYPEATVYAASKRVIGLEIIEGSHTLHASINFKSSAPESLFVMDESYTGCNETAYTKPTNHICKDSASFISNSIWLMIVSMIIFSLF